MLRWSASNCCTVTRESTAAIHPRPARMCAPRILTWRTSSGWSRTESLVNPFTSPLRWDRPPSMWSWLEAAQQGCARPYRCARQGFRSVWYRRAAPVNPLAPGSAPVWWPAAPARKKATPIFRTLSPPAGVWMSVGSSRSSSRRLLRGWMNSCAGGFMLILKMGISSPRVALPCSERRSSAAFWLEMRCSALGFGATCWSQTF